MTGGDDDRTPELPGAEEDLDGLEDLLVFIRDARGFDFTGYKRSTLTRRVRKRIQDAGAHDFKDYRDRLQADANEFNLLFNTILINVTSFFRDTDAWSYLRQEVLPDLVAAVPPSQEIRIWSAGCASGEEAYSLAIAFAELLGLEECLERVKIYGTDVDEEALREARAGLYPAKALEPLVPELREKYFDHNGALYGFRPDLRRRVIFGRHDITRDAPISRLHLLTCRNTLMYFNVEAQSQIIDRFHFALREDGFLFLGKAEMLLSDVDRFETYSMRQRIFRKRPTHTGAHVPPPVRVETYAGPEVRDVSRRRQLRDLVLENSPNAIVIVSADGTVAVINGQARSQFGLTTYDVGRPFSELEVSYRPLELRSLIDQARSEQRPLRAGAVERRLTADEVQYFDILVQPLTGNDGAVNGVAVTFTDTTMSTRLQMEIKRVREDLETAYEELQSTNEELETTNEELQSSIEELETTNEELQSTNEELETTNEELQSGNEELETMNEELRLRGGELDEARSFLEGVLSSVGAAVIVLDSDFKVRSWNRAAEELWGLRAGEVHEQVFFGLDFGLPTGVLMDSMNDCMVSARPTRPVELVAVNRRGRTIRCVVTCSPLHAPGEGVVLLIDEARSVVRDGVVVREGDGEVETGAGVEGEDEG
ncbi:MAG: PAS domain-containing protein [Catenulisporales bacterium]|nr:PAS domain-containing protein [Catenulisporales bacterium]